MKTMNAKEKWVDVLRNGKYLQGRGALKQGRLSFSYCGLGVACEIYRKEFGGTWEGEAFRTGTSFATKSLPPDEVLKWLGISKITAQYLAKANDSLRLSFHEIADLIELNFS